jgi:hypothetical protein
MIDRVKGFSSVEEKKKLTEFTFDGGVKKSVDVAHVIGTLLAGEKTFLGRVDVLINGGHNSVGNTRSEKPVVGVSNTEWTRVGDQTSEFFRESKKEVVVEAFRGVMTFKNGAENFVKNGAGKIRGSPPSGKANAIGAGGGVVRMFNGL